MFRGGVSKGKHITQGLQNLKEKQTQREHGYKVGQYDQHGQEIKNIDQAKGYTGEVYATQDEAVDRRYSKGEELGKRRASLFGNARANIFGN